MSKIDGDPQAQLDRNEEKAGRYDPQDIGWAERGKIETVLQKKSNGRYFTVNNAEHKSFLEKVFAALGLGTQD